MNNLMKLALPLLNDSLKLEDIQEDSGFVEAYFEDKNRPFLYQNLFLMYDPRSNGKNVAHCLYKLSKLDNLYNTRVVYIKGKAYYVYTFTTNKTIELLKDGQIILNTHQKERILKFWEFKDAWVTNNILLGAMFENPEKLELPEEDYRPDLVSNEEG